MYNVTNQSGKKWRKVAVCGVSRPFCPFIFRAYFPLFFLAFCSDLLFRVFLAVFGLLGAKLMI